MLTIVLSDLEDMAESTSWMSWALCPELDPEEWFPEKGGHAVAAKRICAQCPVRSECLSYALDNDIEYGVWGGVSAIERQRIQQQMPAAA